MIHKPASFLRDADMLGELNRRNAFARGREQINGDEPFFERQFAFAEHSSGFDREILSALCTAVTLAIAECINLGVSTVRTILSVTKTDRSEIFATRFLIFEIFQKLGQRFELKYGFHFST